MCARTPRDDCQPTLAELRRRAVLVRTTWSEPERIHRARQARRHHLASDKEASLWIMALLEYAKVNRGPPPPDIQPRPKA